MKLHAKKRLRVGVSIAGILLLLCVTTFLARAWIRDTALPILTSTRYVRSLDASYDTANTELDFPLSKLNIQPQYIDAAGCSRNFADDFYIEIGCSRSVIGETPSLTFEAIGSLSKVTKDLDTRLKKYHWEGYFGEGNEGARSVTDLFDSRVFTEYEVTNEGVEYSKTIHGNSCLLRLSLFTERDPKSGYVFGVLSCNRDRIEMGFTI